MSQFTESGLVELQLQHCFICDGEIFRSQKEFDSKNLDSDSNEELRNVMTTIQNHIENVELCQRFCTLATRYFNIDNRKSLKLLNVTKTLNTKYSHNIQDSREINLNCPQDFYCCESCKFFLEHFCRVHEEFVCLRQILNGITKKITALMRMSKNSMGTKLNHHNENVDNFKKTFLTHAEQIKEFPRLKLTNLNVVTVDEEECQDEDSMSLPYPPDDPLSPLNPNDSNDDDCIIIDEVPQVSKNPIVQLNDTESAEPQLSHHILQPSTSASLTDNKDFKCRFCDKIYKTYGSRYQHEMVHKEKRYRCRFCGRKFLRGQTLKAHERTHTGERPYICSICGYRSSQQYACLTHMKHVHKRKGEVLKDFATSKNSRFQPKISKPNFSKMPNTSKLQNKVKVKVKTELGRGLPYKCRFCGKGFVRLSNRYQHERIHATVKPHKCQFCERQFTQKHSKDSHERTHTGEKPFRCAICSRTFTNWGSCRVHLRGVHKITDYHDKIIRDFVTEGGPVATASNPTSIRKQKLTFTEKLSEEHKNKKSFKCRYCALPLSSRQGQTIHERIHTGEKPYRCALCLRQFRQYSPCKNHLRHVHKIENPSTSDIIKEFKNHPQRTEAEAKFTKKEADTYHDHDNFVLPNIENSYSLHDPLETEMIVGTDNVTSSEHQQVEQNMWPEMLDYVTNYFALPD